MRLIVLGGSAACPNPGQGCSGYLVEQDGLTLLLDCGPGTLPELLRHVRLDQLDAIVISHLHQDHVLDLIPLRYGLKYGPWPVHLPIPVWLPPGGRTYLDRLATAIAIGSEPSEAFFTAVFHLQEYEPTEPLALEPLTIRFQPTRHWIPCWAMRVESAAGTLVYLADTGWSDDLVPFAAGADLLIVEATLPSEAGEAAREGHLTTYEAGQLAALAHAKQVLVTHYWASPDLGEQFMLIERAFTGRVFRARPGLVITLGGSER